MTNLPSRVPVLKHPLFVILILLLVGCGDSVDVTKSSDLAEALKLSTLEQELGNHTALSWQPCGEDFPGIECAVARVPLDYDKPHGAKTGVALARVAATDPEHKIGSVFVNPGGPGGSGIDLILGGFGSDLNAALQGRFDVVGFDPRGVGSSEPLRCFDTEQELVDFINQQPVFPYTRAQRRPFFRHNRALAQRCLERGARIIEHMSTADVARDLDRLRTYVGDEKLTYLGFSYGTQLGNTYANLFPSKVRALVIDGVLDPRLWTSGETSEIDGIAGSEVFAEFARLCDEAGETCAFSGGAAARFEALAAQLRASPLVLEDFIYSYDLFISDVIGALYLPEVWAGPDGLAALLAFVEEATSPQAQATTLTNVASIRQALLSQLQPPQTDEQEAYSNWVEGYYGVRCADAEYPKHFAQWSARGELAGRDSHFGELWWWQDAPCSKWPAAHDRYAGPWTARTAAPVLIVGNYFDPATHYSGAVASNQLLKNSRLLSYAGWGHCAFGRSQCATEYVLSYLLDGSLPPEGTVCPANPSPFLPTVEPGLALLTRAASAPRVTPPPIGLPPPRPGRP